MHYDPLTIVTADSIGTDSASRHGIGSDDYTTPSLAALLAESAGLRSELAAVELARSKLADTQRRIMELLNVQSPDRLVHDIRNLLNERALLRSLVDLAE